MLTILYITDNSLPEDINKLCQSHLSSEGWMHEIITVSQKPIPGKNNICVGEIGRNWKSIYIQLLAGLNACKTKYVGIAEHDVLYIPEHWEFVPQERKFYYNTNHWLVDWNTGEYFFIKNRKAMSQMICDVSLLKEYVEGMLELIEKGLILQKGLHWYGEPGLDVEKYEEYFKRSGIGLDLKIDFIKHIRKFFSDMFKTEFPNLDIRHAGTFTGKKKGINHCYEIPYWGKFKWLNENV